MQFQTVQIFTLTRLGESKFVIELDMEDMLPEAAESAALDLVLNSDLYAPLRATLTNYELSCLLAQCYA